MQLLAATVFTILVGYVMRIVATGATKPYDNMDIGAMLILLVGFISGMGRILWLAFN